MQPLSDDKAADDAGSYLASHRRSNGDSGSLPCDGVIGWSQIVVAKRTDGEGFIETAVAAASAVDANKSAVATACPNGRKARDGTATAKAPARTSLLRGLAWVGLASLLAGLALLLASYFVSRRAVVVTSPAASRSSVASSGANLFVRDRLETEQSAALDACQIGGLLLFCAGGLAIVASLLVTLYSNPAGATGRRRRRRHRNLHQQRSSRRHQWRLDGMPGVDYSFGREDEYEDEDEESSMETAGRDTDRSSRA